MNTVVVNKCAEIRQIVDVALQVGKAIGKLLETRVVFFQTKFKRGDNFWNVSDGTVPSRAS
jgi:hypothetical protein